MSKSSLASLLLLASISTVAACGSRAPAPAPITGTAPVQPAASCDLAGPVLYKRVTTSPRDATVSIVLFASGGWNVDRGGTVVSGCLDPDDLARLDVALTAAPYQISAPPQPRCKAHDGVVTVYEVHGKQVHTYELCGDEVIDSQSHQALTDTDALLETASAPITTGPRST